MTTDAPAVDQDADTEIPAEPASTGPSADAAAARRAVLERLARREIDPATAATELRALGG